MSTKPSSIVDVLRQIANVVAIPFGIAASYLAVQLTGKDVGSVSRANEPLLAAAGWTFAIWGVIFLGQLVYAVYQALPSKRSSNVLRRIGWLTALSSVLTGAWVLVFNTERFVAAWGIMLAILVTLVAIEIRRGDSSRRGPELLLVRVPYSLNLGWIAVATILETSQVLDRVYHWNGGPLSPESWGVVMVAVATALAAMMITLRPNLGFGVAVAWGLAGVFHYEQTHARMISGAALLGVIAIAVLLVVEIVLLATRGLKPALRHQRTSVV
ncbi:hypothetical protein BH09MYX1_BH09MYX1_22460 [soil metagenome]